MKADEGKDARPEEKQRKGSFRDLLIFADGWDRVMMCCAAPPMACAGALMSTMLLFIGDFFETAGSAMALTTNGINMNTVRNTSLTLVYLGLALAAVFTPVFGLANHAAANQKAKWKKESIKAILGQDVGWFDVCRPQELLSKMSEGTVKITKALEFQSYTALQGLGMAAGGFGVGFSKSWSVALVVLASFPVIMLAVGCFIVVLFGGSRMRLKAYSTAGGTATEALFAMRTIASLGIEKVFLHKYETQLVLARRVAMRIAPWTGFTTGLTFSSFIILMIVGFLYGGLTLANEVEASSFSYVLTDGNQVVLSPVAPRPSPLARHPSPVTPRPSLIAHRPSTIDHRPSPLAPRPSPLTLILALTASCARRW